MACWSDISGWVRPQFPDANSDDVARLAVQAMHLISTKLGGFRLYETKLSTSHLMSVEIPKGFMLTQVYSVTLNGKCLPLNRECNPCLHTPSWNASGGTVELYNLHTSMPSEVVIEYGVNIAAGAVSCDVDEDMYNKYAPAVAEYCLSRLQATVTTNRSMHHVSRDYYASFIMLLNDLKREQSRRGESRSFTFGGSLW